jgi:hypothetical protein
VNASVAEDVDFTVESAEAGGVRRYRRLGVILIVAAVGFVGAAWLEADGGARLVDVSSTASRSSVPPILAGVPFGHDVVAEQQISYAPGMWRPWEPRDGLHHVTVVTGTLSVEDDHGFRQDYGAGQSYMAGWSSFATRNRTGDPVEVTVQFLRPSADAKNGPAPND